MGTFSETVSEVCGLECGAGATWQFTTTVNDACQAPIRSFTCLTVCLPSGKQPCCLPGYNTSPDYQHCVPESKNLCEEARRLRTQAKPTTGHRRHRAVLRGSYGNLDETVLPFRLEHDG